MKGQNKKNIEDGVVGNMGLGTVDESGSYDECRQREEREETLHQEDEQIVHHHRY